MKTYIGRTTGDLDWDVFVSNNGGKEKRLNPCYKYVNHSPDGYAWGYGGSGPAQLAFAMVADATNPEIARAVYQQFKSRVIAALPGDKPFTITEEKVLAEIEELLKHVY